VSVKKGKDSESSGVLALEVVGVQERMKLVA
jgi:hypothetical protein